ncbi:DUF4276 family protein [Derxia lacustris]|uniref:DUF4276 family protein n=1 Tax=Derxia lacustris TaxID=764842 RepID=UPI000A16E3E2|nr:DUF4276 family protein [Derxia lacustris]
MSRIAAIVEGQGEEAALPVLLRNLAKRLLPDGYVEVPRPARVHRDRFIRSDDDFRKQLLLAAAKAGADGWILVLLDADDDCPVTLGAELKQRAEVVVPGARISVVLARREFESWFIASAAALAGVRGLSLKPGDHDAPADDGPRNAKKWIADRLPPGVGYGEVADQPAFTAAIDIELAERRSRSFRKLCDEFRRQFPQAPEQE